MAASDSEAQETLIGCKVLWEEELRHGAFGTVYRGKDPDGVDMAIKIMSAEHRFHRSARKEIDSYKQLPSHENVIRILGYIEQSQVLYILMEYCRLGDLSTYCMMYCDIVNSINHSVAFGGIIQRDLKPRNILVTGDPNDPNPLHCLIKICDFGEAKFLSGNSTIHSNLGTRAYKAPEFYANASHDTITYHKNVVFAEGLVFWVMMNARRGCPLEPNLPKSERLGGSGGDMGHEMYLWKIHNKPLLNIAHEESVDCSVTSKVKNLITDQRLQVVSHWLEEISRTIHREVC